MRHSQVSNALDPNFNLFAEVQVGALSMRGRFNGADKVSHFQFRKAERVETSCGTLRSQLPAFCPRATTYEVYDGGMRILEHGIFEHLAPKHDDEGMNVRSLAKQRPKIFRRKA